MVVKFKPIFHGKSKFTHNKQKVYQIMMGVVNWEQNGYKIKEIEQNIQKMIKQQFKLFCFSFFFPLDEPFPMICFCFILRFSLVYR